MKLNPNVIINEKKGWTPLHYVANDSNAQAVRVLIAVGANQKTTDLHEKTAYMIANEKYQEASKNHPSQTRWFQYTENKDPQDLQDTLAAFNVCSYYNENDEKQ